MGTPARGSFENEALENEDRGTKHPRSKTKHLKLENEAPKNSKPICPLYKHETMNANTAGIKRDNESNAVQILLFQNSPVPHQRAWSQAITLEQILDLIWASRSDIDIKYVRLQNNRFFFFSKSVKKSVKSGVRVIRASLTLRFQPRFRTFVLLLTRT